MSRGRPEEPQSPVLPPLFDRWMSHLLPGPIPEERAATCNQCAMLRPDGETEGESEFFFSPATKCCTYLPEISNFLVGRVLGDNDPAAARGRATVEARIDAGVAVTPLALHRTSRYTLLYRSSPASFGHAASMLCPHYLADSGQCGVWKSRESTCATWFCKHGRGIVGRTFWQRLHDTLSAAEEALRLHAALEVGIDAEAMRRLFPPHALSKVAAQSDGLSASDVDGAPNAAHNRAIWGKWHGKERAFYCACAELVAPLLWRDVVRLGGARLELLQRLLLDAYEELVSTAVPSRTRGRQLKVIYTSHDSAHLVGYSNIDPLRVPKKLVEALSHFDGRATNTVLGEIAEEHALRLAPGVVRKLVDFGVLADESQNAGRKNAG